MENEIAEDIRNRGLSVVNVFDARPPFLYTVGLIETWTHPELIIFRLEAKTAAGILAKTVASIKNGVIFDESSTYSTLLPSGDKIAIRKVHPTQHIVYLGYAMGRCREIRKDLQAVQLFWSDVSGKFPFDVGCEQDVFQSQPRLDIAMSPLKSDRLKDSLSKHAGRPDATTASLTLGGAFVNFHGQIRIFFRGSVGGGAQLKN
jgi:hypothetical protein